MPSGVEHNKGANSKNWGAVVLAAPMPSGVEHTGDVTGTTGANTFSPLRCPRALSTWRLSHLFLGDAAVLAAPMPSGVEHTAMLSYSSSRARFSPLRCP